jgi:adenosylhomocysteine nucleosidase
MNVLVTFAVEAEFAPWRRRKSLQAVTVGEFEILQTQIGCAAVDFVVTGMGADNARRGAEAAMTRTHALCIAAGFAGALRENYKIGDVLAARAVQQMGQPEAIACSPNLQRAACENHALDTNLLFTADRVIRTAAEKRQLSVAAGAVDMESFATLSAAQRNHLPALALRVVSDRCDEELPVDISTTLDERGRVKIAAVAKYVASHPLQLPALIRLGRHSRAAAESLAQFLESFIQDLSSREEGGPPRELQEAAAQ